MAATTAWNNADFNRGLTNRHNATWLASKLFAWPSPVCPADSRISKHDAAFIPRHPFARDMS
jgi:hypothetical protein